MCEGGTVFEELDSQMQKDLLEWYNIVDPSDEDKALLAQLAAGGKFYAWWCPACYTRCLDGRPDDWDNFQGVCQEETLGELCQECAGKYLYLKQFAGE